MTLLRQRDRLRFLNPAHTKGVWRLIEQVSSREEYELWRDELFDDAQSQIERLGIKGPVWLGLLGPPVQTVNLCRVSLSAPPPKKKRSKKSAPLSSSPPQLSPASSSDSSTTAWSDRSFFTPHKFSQGLPLVGLQNNWGAEDLEGIARDTEHWVRGWPKQSRQSSWDLEVPGWLGEQSRQGSWNLEVHRSLGGQSRQRLLGL